VHRLSTYLRRVLDMWTRCDTYLSFGYECETATQVFTHYAYRYRLTRAICRVLRLHVDASGSWEVVTPPLKISDIESLKLLNTLLLVLKCCYHPNVSPIDTYYRYSGLYQSLETPFIETVKGVLGRAPSCECRCRLDLGMVPCGRHVHIDLRSLKSLSREGLHDTYVTVIRALPALLPLYSAKRVGELYMVRKRACEYAGEVYQYPTQPAPRFLCLVVK